MVSAWTRGDAVKPAAHRIGAAREFVRWKAAPTLIGGLLLDPEPIAPGGSADNGEGGAGKTAARAGEQITAVITLDAPNALEYVMVEAPRPAGCEPFNPLSGRDARLMRTGDSKPGWSAGSSGSGGSHETAGSGGSGRNHESGGSGWSGGSHESGGSGGSGRNHESGGSGGSGGSGETGGVLNDLNIVKSGSNREPGGSDENDGLPIYREEHDDRSVFFLDRLDAGRWQIRFPMRAVTRGDYRALPAEVSAMYAPDIRAHTDARRVRIE
ncbi:MAG: hypothetical protein LBC18_00400 [Opitutaceae bacterium]|nr:hypothetical protein [Opitutaceae bacterium]